MRELYALVVGEAGVDPRYFLREMTPSEAADYIEGYKRRQRSDWERSRVGWFIAVNDGKGNKDMKEMFPFAWDPKPRRTRVTKRQRDELRRRAEALAAQMQRRQQDGKE